MVCEDRHPRGARSAIPSGAGGTRFGEFHARIAGARAHDHIAPLGGNGDVP
jgi:hypothetical protein